MSRRQMRLKTLEGYLQEVDVFDKPKFQLEQYPTTPHIAAQILHDIHMKYDDIQDKCIADLGVGCGVLSIGCSMLGCGFVLGVDIDSAAISRCQENLSQFEITNIDLLQQDVTSLLCEGSHLQKAFDTVIMNPPFGTKNTQGIDMIFLKTALAMAHTSVYSLHKTSTRRHIIKQAGDWGAETEVVAELRFDLANTMKSHKKKTMDIAVDFIRFTHKNQSATS
ncbi:rRNA N6-adenosine-methyltransferase METTL5-like [Gigantopelta aegis]|uniref:rRNA N6-adenosine-methyltransferase METTL5-like n=1 Tax=Gigantopelta aegis TaxID=1735272 RepID=UPI001B88D6B3|nr:rRNA N6-adenosine-methyltransferase METTL5-like [Gigantopelta aegis]